MPRPSRECTAASLPLQAEPLVNRQRALEQRDALVEIDAGHVGHVAELLEQLRPLPFVGAALLHELERVLPVANGVFPGVDAHRRVAGLPRIGDGLGGVTAFVEVVGELPDDGLDASGADLLEGAPGAQVQPLLARQRQLAVQRFLHQRVREAVRRAAAAAAFVDEPRPERVLQDT